MLNRQKELEQQLNDEQVLYQELQEKYDKACEKREAMKDDLHQVQQQLEKSKSDYKSPIDLFILSSTFFVFFSVF